jgi:response regulator NasT
MQQGLCRRPIAIICEDEALTSAALAQCCEELGYEVAARPRDGVEAVGAALSLQPDLVLMDIKMPRLDGIEAARQILSQLDTTILIITGHVTEAFVKGAAAAGVAGYLVKPVSFDQLHSAIGVGAGSVRRRRQAEQDAEAARRDLANRKLIERAKGVLMEERRISEREAYRLLQKRSQDERRSMASLAEEVLRAREDAGQDA